MKKLTDVYIKVTKANVEELRTIIQPNLDVDDIVAFNSDCLNSFFYGISIGNRKKVSLAELKRLIDTIPTREEITRLKQKISGFKTNLSLTNERCKELQSDNERLVHENNMLKDKLSLQKTLSDMLEEENKQLKQRKFWQIWK